MKKLLNKFIYFLIHGLFIFKKQNIMGKGRVPSRLGLFNQYILQFVAWLVAIKNGQTDNNAKRNGVSTNEVSAFQSFLASWHTEPPAAPGAYDLHTDPATKTKLTGITVRGIVKNFKAAARPVLDRLKGSANMDATDFDVLNIALPVTSHSQHTAPIEDNVYLRHSVVGAGKLKVACFSAKDAKRASINKATGANAIQFAICIFDPKFDGSETNGSIKGTAITSVNDCLYREVHTKATIIYDTQMKHRGCDIYIYARLYDVKHPELAGPWCEPLITPVP